MDIYIIHSHLLLSTFISPWILLLQDNKAYNVVLEAVNPRTGLY